MNEHMIIIHKSLLTPRKLKHWVIHCGTGGAITCGTHTHVIRFGLFHSDQQRLTEQIHTRPMISCRSVFLSAWCLYGCMNTGKIYNQIRNRFNLAPSLLSFFSILSHWPYFRFMVGSFGVMKNFEESRNFSFGLAKRQQKKRGPLTKRKPRFFGWSWWCIKSTDGREREKNTHTHPVKSFIIKAQPSYNFIIRCCKVFGCVACESKSMGVFRGHLCVVCVCLPPKLKMIILRASFYSYARFFSSALALSRAIFFLLSFWYVLENKT